MNPHFIFNALNSVNNYIAKNDERSANRYLSDFSGLMRAVLENSEEDFIPLTKELELLRLYLKLEHSRFPEKFDYKIRIDDQPWSLTIIYRPCYCNPISKTRFGTVCDIGKKRVASISIWHR